MEVTMENKMPEPKQVTVDNRVLNILEKDIDIRAQQLEVQQGDLELKKQQDINMYTYALKALEVKAEDNKQKREHEKSTHTTTIILIVFIIVVIAVIVGLSLWLDKDQFANEIIKAIVYIGPSFAGGYGIASYKLQHYQKSPDSQDNN